MPDLDRRQLLAYGALVLAIVALGVRYVHAQAARGPSGDPARVGEDRAAGGSTGGATAGDGGGSASGGGAGDVSVAQAGGGRVTVHVAGAVRRPGVYRMRASERIDDAVTRAGGPTARADLAGVNLAAKVEDGRQILVPVKAGGGDAGGGGAAAGTGAPATGTAATGTAAGGGATGGLGAAGPKLNLNTATLEQLDTLAGVGPATAEKILAYRTEHGGFSKVSELAEVPGIGEKRLETLSALVTV